MTRILAVFIAAMVLAGVAGCAKKKIPTGSPPQAAVSARPAPDSPQVSPYVARATSKPYTVSGNTYHPVTSAHGWSEEGIASWYGSDFHGKKTASGQVYDMHKLTAAHKLLPIGTRVEVENLENGRKVLVLVNDRGPFVRDRIIDLSHAAALQIDMVNSGVARVRVRTVGTNPGVSAAGDITGPFYVQVGSFTGMGNARKSLADLIDQGYDNSRMLEVSIAGTTYYRVQAGVFRGLAKAKKGLSALKTEYPTAFLIAD